jgi:hypothetical protein
MVMDQARAGMNETPLESFDTRRMKNTNRRTLADRRSGSRLS